MYFADRRKRGSNRQKIKKDILHCFVPLSVWTHILTLCNHLLSTQCRTACRQLICRPGYWNKVLNTCFRLSLDTADIYGGWLFTQMTTCSLPEGTTRILQCGGEINYYGASRCAANTNLWESPHYFVCDFWNFFANLLAHIFISLLCYFWNWFFVPLMRLIL